MADVTDPVLTSLSIPTTVDLSKGKAAFTIAATASDPESGIDQLVVNFDKSIAYTFGLSSETGGSYSLFVNSGIYDSWADGASSQTWGIRDTNSGGTYKVTSATVTDKQGNTTTYTSSQLAAMGVNTSVSLTGAAIDPKQPTLTFIQRVNDSQGELLVDIYSDPLTAGALSLSATFTYTASKLAFDQIEFSSNSSSVSYSSSISGGQGLVDFNASAVTISSNSPIATLVFKGVGSGTFDLDFSSLRLNGSTPVYADPPSLPFSILSPPLLVNPISDKIAVEAKGFNFQIPGNTFADADSLIGLLSYTATLANGSTLPSWLNFNPTSHTFFGIPSNDDIGSIQIKVTATDPSGLSSSDIFSLTVQNTNDSPIGKVEITGTATQSQTLKASNDLQDADGLGAISYQWQASSDGINWISINGATGDTFLLLQPQVGQLVRVNASYTDGHGQIEFMPSTPTAKVTNINDAPTGSVIISGQPIQGQALEPVMYSTRAAVGLSLT